MVELQVRLMLEIDGEERVVTLSKADAERLRSELSEALGPKITINPPHAPHFVPVPYPPPCVIPRPWLGMIPPPGIGDGKITCGTTTANCTLKDVTAYHSDARSLLP
jgi:hypothetical protein